MTFYVLFASDVLGILRFGRFGALGRPNHPVAVRSNPYGILSESLENSFAASAECAYEYLKDNDIPRIEGDYLEDLGDFYYRFKYSIKDRNDNILFEDIKGKSASFLMALAIIEQLTETDAVVHSISATGVLDEMQGKVNRVEGLRKKFEAAINSPERPNIIFYPQGNQKTVDELSEDLDALAKSNGITLKFFPSGETIDYQNLSQEGDTEPKTIIFKGVSTLDEAVNVLYPDLIPQKPHAEEERDSVEEPTQVEPDAPIPPGQESSESQTTDPTPPQPQIQGEPEPLPTNQTSQPFHGTEEESPQVEHQDPTPVTQEELESQAMDSTSQQPKIPDKPDPQEPSPNRLIRLAQQYRYILVGIVVVILGLLGWLLVHSSSDGAVNKATEFLHDGKYAEAYELLSEKSENRFSRSKDKLNELKAGLETPLVFEEHFEGPNGASYRFDAEELRGLRLRTGQGYYIYAYSSKEDNGESYLYLFQIDDDKNRLAKRLFPHENFYKGLENPIHAGQQLKKKENDSGIPLKSFSDDRQEIKETIYLVASRWPADDLDDAYQAVEEARATGKGYVDAVDRLEARILARQDANLPGIVFKEFSFTHTR